MRSGRSKANSCSACRGDSLPITRRLTGFGTASFWPAATWRPPCEIVDFWRFNVHYGQELLHEQPFSDHSMWNQLEYRGLEGFVYAVTPFNFTSIAANLPTAPALMGNTVVWKPASSAMYSAYYLMSASQTATAESHGIQIS